jgi:hypothetical protein
MEEEVDEEREVEVLCGPVVTLLEEVEVETLWEDRELVEDTMEEELDVLEEEALWEEVEEEVEVVRGPVVDEKEDELDVEEEEEEEEDREAEVEVVCGPVVDECPAVVVGTGERETVISAEEL